MTEIIQGRVRANGIDFVHLEAGDGPLALCLHGFPDTAWGWEPLLTDLAAAGFRAVAPFMRGYAPSSVAADGRYQTGVLALDAIALHEALGGDDTAVLIGHDWGALATYGATVHEPGRWRRAVAASVPPASVMGPALLDYDNLKHRFWYQFFFCNPLSDVAVAMNDLAFIERLWADWSPGLDAGPHLTRVKDALRDPANLTAALSYYRQTLGGIGQDPAIADVQAASFQTPSIPVLYLHGTDDGCMPCPDVSTLAAALPGEGSRVELVEGAGHFLQYEAPQRVNRSIVDFLTA
ncbi:alpha/beta fold hydrolase [Rhabdothermincola sediminis]|uniref:alpha/beta fold hydrolase n=1 Tax=Rhabdothermincola sediminis TaxID=2751370 RepID=UPI001AA050BC|nr:alpha/beta hydrolase [Rhabdothermincola sediminis]